MQRQIPSWPDMVSPLQKLDSELYERHGVDVYIKRDDLLTPCGGNKWRKLKYYHKRLIESGKDEFVTFGGPFSNHLYAAAEFSKYFGVRGIACVRGSVDDSSNPVLTHVRQCGLQIVSLSREQYARRYEADFYQTVLHEVADDALIIPEGGSGQDGLRGCAEIVEEVAAQLTRRPGYWITAAGTGTTAVGIAGELQDNECVFGVSALREKIARPALDANAVTLSEDARKRIIWTFDYHLGGLARWNDDLLNAIKIFNQRYSISLDPLYTGKAIMALDDMVERGQFKPGSTIVFIHTGGVPGRMAFEYRYGKKLDG